MNNRPTILDCTLRDGTYVSSFNALEIKEITAGLVAAKVDYIEIGQGLGMGYYRKSESLMPDIEYINHATKDLNRLDSKIGAFFIPGPGNKDDLKIAKDYGLDFIRIGTNASEYEAAYEYIECALGLGLEVYYNAMKSYILSPFEFMKLSSEIEKTGAQGVYLVDSAGGMIPDDVYDYIKLVKENTKLKVGFHGHNNLMLANANNIAAIKADGDLFDCTLMGLGRGGGNSPTEIMLFILEKFNIDLNINSKIILDLAKKHISEKSPIRNDFYDIDVISGFAMFHSSFLDTFTKVAKRNNVDLKDLIIKVCAVNKENPSQELIEQIANELNSAESQIFSPRSIGDL